jgi:hypothetical protein
MIVHLISIVSRTAALSPSLALSGPSMASPRRGWLQLAVIVRRDA